ncbi:hypothetical protein PHLGIDRAFT_426104 [Phlebiopsis gigantea 11061_1 CR5-6]|uniref:Secreted protein n=1 Tax=Phlebiopsis gigantea (strain 11061_1 CR5-6) TaxID=745531 RepID=A0A0C3SAU3_PHLG1|nr:hypothetical protein PHLGIDRAFT_426104 [Phlebiopsis gigantea 11061_1 CR5-6]
MGPYIMLSLVVALVAFLCDIREGRSGRQRGLVGTVVMPPLCLNLLHDESRRRRERKRAVFILFLCAANSSDALFEPPIVTECWLNGGNAGRDANEAHIARRIVDEAVNVPVSPPDTWLLVQR